MTTRLQLYNGALLICGDTRLASLSEAREPRHLLDEVWNDGGVQYCLEQGQWRFAMRASRFDYDPSIQPDWGYQRGYTKPTDWIATSGVFQDEFLKCPLLQYADEVGYWFCDRDEIFVKYVSNAATYGNDLARWTATFTDYVKAYFASRIIRRLPGGADRVDDICHPKTGVLAKALLVAKNKDAMAGPATFPARGSWIAARRQGANRTYWDGGNPNQLIG